MPTSLALSLQSIFERGAAGATSGAANLASLDWWFWVGLSLALLLIIAGLIGTVLPLLPGTIMIFAGAVLLGWVTDFTEITVFVLIGLGLLAVFSQAMDYLASSIGAKKFGSSRWGIAGAIVGSIVGLVIGGPFGFAIFPFLFAFLFELIAAGQSAKKSLRTAFGSLIGVLGGIVMQFIFGLVMVLTIVIAVLW